MGDFKASRIVSLNLHGGGKMRAYQSAATWGAWGVRWSNYVSEDELSHLKPDVGRPDWEGDYSTTCPRCHATHKNQFDMRHIMEALRDVTPEQVAAARDPA